MFSRKNVFVFLSARIFRAAAFISATTMRVWVRRDQTSLRRQKCGRIPAVAERIAVARRRASTRPAAGN
jgi:hypothetical protein